MALGERKKRKVQRDSNDGKGGLEKENANVGCADKESKRANDVQISSTMTSKCCDRLHVDAEFVKSMSTVDATSTTINESVELAVSKAKPKGRGSRTIGKLSLLLNMPVDVFVEVREGV